MINQEIKLILPGELIQVAIDALNLYFRMYLGQYDSIDELYLWNHAVEARYDRNADKERDKLLAQIRDVLMPDMRQDGFLGSRGIYNELNDPRCMDAYNLMCSIRSAWAWFSNPHPAGMSYTVDYRPPTEKGRYRPAQCVIKQNEVGVSAEITMCRGQQEILIDAAHVYNAALHGYLRKLFAYFTDDRKLLNLAEEAEKYYPINLNKQAIGLSEKYSLMLGKWEEHQCE